MALTGASQSGHRFPHTHNRVGPPAFGSTDATGAESPRPLAIPCETVCPCVPVLRVLHVECVWACKSITYIRFPILVLKISPNHFVNTEPAMPCGLSPPRDRHARCPRTTQVSRAGWGPRPAWPPHGLQPPAGPRLRTVTSGDFVDAGRRRVHSHAPGRSAGSSVRARAGHRRVWAGGAASLCVVGRWRGVAVRGRVMRHHGACRPWVRARVRARGVASRCVSSVGDHDVVTWRVNLPLQRLPRSRSPPLSAAAGPHRLVAASARWPCFGRWAFLLRNRDRSTYNKHIKISRSFYKGSFASQVCLHFLLICFFCSNPSENS